MERVGDFQLGGLLGKGAYGVVYKGLHVNTNEVVAIKQIDLTTESTGGIEMEEIMGEIELLKKLTHENIVRYVSFLKTAQQLNIILEFVEGGSLTSVVKKRGKLPEDEVSGYAKQILEGLMYLHGEGVVHCDIKCANILTTRSGILKLTDFGVSRKLKSEEEYNQEVVGTPYWMAPEVIQIQGVTPASDIWSFGCTIIELLTGRPPYHELRSMTALYRIVQDDHPPFPIGISPELEDFLLKIFQKDPHSRWSAKRLLEHPFILHKRKTQQEDVPFLKMSTKHSKDELQKAFQLFDENNTQKISLDSAKILLRGLGCSWTDDEFSNTFKEKELTEMVFETLYSLYQSCPSIDSQLLLDSFKELEVDEISGKLSVPLLRAWCTTKGNLLTNTDFELFLSTAPQSSPNVIDYNAWVTSSLPS